MTMNTLRDTINTAKAHELATSQLARLLEKRVSNLHPAIRLPSENSVPALVNFIISYIEHVPAFIEAVTNIAEEAGITEYTKPVINVANEFFRHPPKIVAGVEGLVALMDEAYLAHRLIEEINDRYMAHFGTPLVPMDMTRSNLIIHHLIGEPFANQLDDAVHATVDQMEDQSSPALRSKFKNFTGARENKTLAQALTRWPCLIDTLSINLRLGASARITMH